MKCCQREPCTGFKEESPCTICVHEGIIREGLQMKKIMLQDDNCIEITLPCDDPHIGAWLGLCSVL